MKEKVLAFIKKRKWWLGGGALLAVGIILIATGGGKKEYLFEEVAFSTVSETILATGQVVSDTDLELSFSQSGIINTLPTVGKKVSRGQILASLQNNNELANLSQAQASLSRAEANYQKLIDGAGDADVEVARVALQNAKVDYDQTLLQQNRIVENAYRSLLSSGLEAVASTNSTEVAPTVTGTYNSSVTGQYSVQMYSSGSGARFSVNGLESVDGYVDASRPVPLGSRGLFLEFSDTNTINTTWVIDIPNTRSSSYVSNLNAYELAQETRDITLSVKQSAINVAEANLNSLLADATGPEMDLLIADIDYAKAQVQSALARVEDTRIRAPEGGVVTRVDGELGQLVKAYESTVVLQDTEKLFLEANVNEANVLRVTPGMLVEVTFDALSFDEIFTGKVVSIDIAPTLVSGVVNYRIRVSLDVEPPSLRPGMTANMELIVDRVENVLAVPSRALIEREGGYVVLIQNGKDVEERNVVVGFKGDGNLVEIQEGLVEGEQVVVNPEK